MMRMAIRRVMEWVVMMKKIGMSGGESKLVCLGTC